MVTQRTPENHRRVSLAVLVSFLLHLAVLFVFQRWVHKPMDRVLHPVRYQVPSEAPERFRPALPGALPQVQMERLEQEERPAELPADLVESVQEPVPLEPALTVEEAPVGVEKTTTFQAPAESLLSFDSTLAILS